MLSWMRGGMARSLKDRMLANNLRREKFMYHDLDADDPRRTLRTSSDSVDEDCEAFSQDNTRTRVVPWLKVSLGLLKTALTIATLWFIVRVWQHLRANWGCDTTCKEFVSPFMKDIDRSTHTVTWPPFQYVPSRFTQSAADVGDAVDKQWTSLGVWLRAIIVPPEYASDLDINDSHVLITPENRPGAPSTGYAADIQVFHRLHCLNLIRQALWHNVDHYRNRTDVPMWAPDQTEDVIKAHVAHCIDDIRIHLMCEADIRVVPYYPHDAMRAMPDFARNKQCRNFESVLEWAKKHEYAGANPMTHLP